MRDRGKRPSGKAAFLNIFHAFPQILLHSVGDFDGASGGEADAKWKEVACPQCGGTFMQTLVNFRKFILAHFGCLQSEGVNFE